METEQSRGINCDVYGRLTKNPEGAQTSDGITVCRLLVAGRPRGNASAPARVGVYLKGQEAKRCLRGLRDGDLIEVEGELGERRTKKSVPYSEVLVPEGLGAVKLWARETAVAG